MLFVPVESLLHVRWLLSVTAGDLRYLTFYAIDVSVTIGNGGLNSLSLFGGHF